MLLRSNFLRKIQCLEAICKVLVIWNSDFYQFLI